MNAGGGLGHIIGVELSKKLPGEPQEEVKTDESGHEAKTEVKTEVLGKYEVHIGDAFQVPDSQLKIEIANLVPDFVRDGENGLLFNPGETGDLESKFRKILGNKQLYEKLKKGVERPKSTIENAIELGQLYKRLNTK